jgi:RNA ligase (TIGR02306 family)
MREKMTRKLASIRAITDLRPIANADNIIIAMIDGWQMITQKSNNFQVGDLVCFFEIDSFLPVRPEFEFLRKACFKSTQHLGDGFRLRSIKLRGELSQGLILPLPEVMKGVGAEYFKGILPPNTWVIDGVGSAPHENGTDLTEFLGVKLYEKPLSPQLAGKAKGSLPHFIRKTDQERVQNLIGKIPHDKHFEMTMKLDGSSMTVFRHEDRFGVCSRNLELTETEDNTFWKVARKLRLEEALQDLHEHGVSDIALQGELMGPGIQGNPEKLLDHEFFLFDIFDIKTQSYRPSPCRLFILNHLQKQGFSIRHVPIIYSDVILGDTPTLLTDILTMAEGKSLNGETEREGIVLKSLDGQFSFKAISNKYLLKEKD